MAWYTRSWKKSEDSVRAVARSDGGIGGKYYDSKQQETVMDRRERAHEPRAAFPLYKSPPVLRIDAIVGGARRLLLEINALKSRQGDSIYHKHKRTHRAANIGGIDKGMREKRERSAIGLETAALIDATGKREWRFRGFRVCGRETKEKIRVKRKRIIGRHGEKRRMLRERGERSGRDRRRSREERRGCSTSNEERESM
ncbi:hypothetical protein ALC53_07210 [Atta colombica]|uniref:Uncharacterized protein n=1 Tax=Atta colombica TaxID=520822 RepID=A0A195BDE9_9HYME|nr:hypothetical protein ALC53_07210 [Atta colombica]